MRKQFAALAALSALALPASAQASAIITYSSTTAIPGPGGASGNDNMFFPELSGLGLAVYASTGATIVLDAAHYIQFEFLGSESGYSDTFTAGHSGEVSWTETSPHETGENHFVTPIDLGSALFGALDLKGLLGFTSNYGEAATVGDYGFAIFLPEKYAGSGSLTLNNGDSFYLGFDDERSTDDNHDDFIVRATLLPAVPEPSTWLLMIMGFGAIGFGMRQRKQTQRIRFNFA